MWTILAIPEPLAAPRAAPVAQRRAPWRALVAGCLALATVSLLGPHVPTYDPTAWLIWGREIVHLDLSTLNGPSWKPLPVLFTAPFALTGNTLAPLLWLVVARAGGLLALALTYRVATRLAGPVAGVVAVAALVLENVFVVDFARGNSEGLQVALTLWAIERHLEGRPREAFAFGVVGGLLRPELWPFVGLYGLWLAGRDRRRGTLALVVGGGAALLALWFVPDYLGSGELTRSAARAAVPVDGTPGQAGVPFVAVLASTRAALVAPAFAGALVAVLARRDATVLGVAGLAVGLTLLVALGAQLGFTGGPRYLALPAALVCVLAGLGWAELLGAAARRHGGLAACALAAAALAACAPLVSPAVTHLRLLLDGMGEEATQYAGIDIAVAAAGGKASLARCGPVFSSRYDTQWVAWYLDRHQYEVTDDAIVPGMTLAARGSKLARDSRFPPVSGTGRWVIGSACAPPIRRP